MAWLTRLTEQRNELIDVGGDGADGILNCGAASYSARDFVHEGKLRHIVGLVDVEDALR